MTDKKKIPTIAIVLVVAVIAIIILYWLSQRATTQNNLWEHVKSNGNGGGNGGGSGGNTDLINTGTTNYMEISVYNAEAVNWSFWDQKFKRIGSDVVTNATIRDRLDLNLSYGHINSFQYNNALLQLEAIGL